MGRITLFVKPDCRYCTKAKRVLKYAIRNHVLAVKDDIHPFYGIEIVTVDVSKDASRSAQCIELSGGSRTVPQIFFNDVRMGTVRNAEVLLQCGELGKKLRELASQPSARFPPDPEAAMVKVTEDGAFSSQPTLGQVNGLRRFGFASLVNLVHPEESGFLRSESTVAISSGIAYFDMPPERAPRFPVAHVEVDALPQLPTLEEESPTASSGGNGDASTSPTDESRPWGQDDEEENRDDEGTREEHGTRDKEEEASPVTGEDGYGWAQEEKEARRRGVTIEHVDDDAVKKLPVIGRPCSPALVRPAGSELSPGGHSPPSSSPSDIPSSERTPKEAAIGEDDDDGTLLPHEPTLPSVPFAVGDGRSVSTGSGLTDVSTAWELDASNFDASIAVRPEEIVFTPSWMENVIQQVDDAPKPVLVHCLTGVASCAVMLVRAAVKLRVTPYRVYRWAHDLGHSIEAHSDLQHCVETLLANHEPN